LSVTKEKVKVNTDSVMTKTEMMKYLAIIDYYKFPYSVDDFIHDKNYRKESMKKRVFDEYLKKYDYENMVKHLDGGKFGEYIKKMIDLKTLPKKVNDNKRKVEKIIKYLKVIRQFKIEYDEDLYI
jgi:predicted RNA-binding protein